jgi:hypothetical protein
MTYTPLSEIWLIFCTIMLCIPVQSTTRVTPWMRAKSEKERKPIIQLVVAYTPDARTVLCHSPCRRPRIYRLLAPLRTRLPTTPAATAKPPTMAMPIRPSLATLSSMSDPRLAACRFAGSFSRSRSLYRRASP